MSSIKLPHSSGNSMSIAAPATNPASDLTLQLPNSVGTGKINHGNVLEQFFSPCDGSAITVPSGTYTVSDVTAEQDLTSSFATCSGSSISYTPPAGTTMVIYEYHFQIRYKDQTPMVHFRTSIGGTEVTNFRRTQRADYQNMYDSLKFCFHIGGSASTTTGRQATWTSAKTILIEAREYGSDQEAYLHSQDRWDGATVTAYVTKPSIGITAIGTPA